MRYRFIPGILVVLALAGCNETPVVSAPPAILPAPPSDFGKPVAVKPPKVGDDARGYAARERAGRLTANRRLANDAAFYADVRAKLGAEAAH